MNGNNREALKRLFQKNGFSEAVEIDIDQITFSEIVFSQCKRNTCGSYGKNYACPPLSGTLEDCIGRIKKYDKAFVINYVTSMKTSAEMVNGGESFSEACNSLRKDLEESDIDSAVMAAGPCRLCKECAALEGLPCRFPDKVRYSMEGSGIDVVRLSMNLGMKYNSGPGTMTYFAMVLFKDK